MKILRRQFSFQIPGRVIVACLILWLTSPAALAFSLSSLQLAAVTPSVRTVAFVIALLLIVAMCAALVINCLAFSQQSAGNSKTPAKPLDLLWVIIPIAMMLILLQPAVKSIWAARQSAGSAVKRVHNITAYHARRGL